MNKKIDWDSNLPEFKFKRFSPDEIIPIRIFATCDLPEIKKIPKGSAVHRQVCNLPIVKYRNIPTYNPDQDIERDMPVGLFRAAEGSPLYNSYKIILTSPLKGIP